MFSYPKRKLRKMVQRGEYQEALAFGRSISGQYPEDPDFLFIMGSIHYVMEEYQDTIKYLEEAVSLKHDDIEALMLKTNAHLALNQSEAAVACCMHILKVNGDHEEARSLLRDLGGSPS